MFSRCSVIEAPKPTLLCPIAMSGAPVEHIYAKTSKPLNTINDEHAAKRRLIQVAEQQRFTIVDGVDLNNDFNVKSALDGHNASVHVCIASITKNQSTMQWLNTKLMLHCRLHHPHVLKYHDVFLSDNEIHIVFEHPQGSSLLSFLMQAKLDEHNARYLFQQLVFVVDYMHRMGLTGLDLTLDNVFIDPSCGILKLINFGYLKKTASGTVYPLPYIAPEQINNPTEANNFCKETDIWRLGVLLYSLLFQTFPFARNESGTAQDQILSVLQASWTTPSDRKLSSDCRDLLGRIFNPRPTQRITLDEIKHHSWYNKNLPSGVSSYQELPRPDDGLVEKAERISYVLGLKGSLSR